MKFTKLEERNSVLPLMPEDPMNFCAGSYEKKLFFTQSKEVNFNSSVLE